MRKPSAPASALGARSRPTSSIGRGKLREVRRARRSLALAAALVFVLVVAATAQASLGIIGYFPFEALCRNPTCHVEAPGEFADTGASAVNADGTGGASAGDVYILDKGSLNGNSLGRIQQFSASDQFVRLWGPGVVKSGPDNADEVQAVRVDATGGAFKLGFGASTTADISAGASAAQVQSALNGLVSIGAGGVSVSGGPGGSGGTTPYLVTFEGAGLAGSDQPVLKATNGSTPLSGAAATVSAYATVQGGAGFEICRPANGDECTYSNGGGGSGDSIFSRAAGLGGNLRTPRDMAVDQANGNLYVSNRGRLEAYSATGQFIRAWGKDVVASGPDDSSGPDEEMSVGVTADGGTFTLGYRSFFTAAVENTVPIPFGASPAVVETALNNLGQIGGAYSSVTVTEGSGGSNTYVIRFHGLLGGDDLNQVIVSNPNGLTGAGRAVEVETIADGGGYEVCERDDACKDGVRGSSAGAFGGEGPPAVAVAPPSAPNAGDVLAADGEKHLVQEFTPQGIFVRSFGWDVDQANPSTGFEVCTAESGHICKAGASGAGVGQLAWQSSLAEDSSGAIYTVETPSNEGFGARVQKFTPAGGLDLTPSPLGTNEVQALTVNAGAGQFRLTLGAQSAGTSGTGILTAGSSVITNVTTTTGAFAPGQPIRTNTGFRNYIVAVGANTITLGEPSPQSSCCGPETFFSGRLYTTPDLPFNAAASEVESALNSLPSINAGGGSVSVSGGPGNATGSSPYLIDFDGGSLVRTDPAQIAASSGSIPLSGGTGPGANTASGATTTPGGPSGTDPSTSFESDTPFYIAIGLGNHVFVAKSFPQSFSKCATGAPSPYETRIEELDSTGAVIQTSDPCSGISGISLSSSVDQPALTVNPSTGHPYLQGFAGLNVFGPQGPPPSLTIEPVSDIGAIGGKISGTVNPNGPGTSYPDTSGAPSVTKTTYRVEYKKASESTWAKYTPDIPVGNGTSASPFSVGVSGLAPSTEYELKMVVVKPFTATVEEVRSFTTLPAAPEVEAFSTSNVTVDSADLQALINPQGSPTSYHFEYGTTPAYGSSTPETNIGEAHEGQGVQDRVEGLADVVYHFRVVATNPSGTTTSADQTFTFHPPVCPNQTVRQQTGAAYLPDCRAYELVSPEDAGGATLFTGGPQSAYASNPPRLAFVGQLAAIPGSGGNPINTTGDLYVATRGASGWSSRYVGPSAEEAGCVGGRPIVSGTGPPSTIQNDVMADPSLNRIIDWNLGNPVECFNGFQGGLTFTDLNTAARGSNAPYVWDAHGDLLDRWPTSVADVPGSETSLSCPQDPTLYPYPSDSDGKGGLNGNVPVPYFCSTYVDASKDLSHFVFSTQSGLYGEGGLTSAPGSAYDNDTAHNTLRLISQAPGGGPIGPIGQEPGGKAGPEELIQFPAVSANGSHIMMGTATRPACKQIDFPRHVDLGPSDYPLCPIITQPTHLYMRVNDAVTYDISAGKAVRYIGSTPDGNKVYFTSDEQLSGDDTDQSTDLYMWSENGGAPQLTRISAGDPSPAGNSDSCASTWTTDCDVKTYDDSRITAAEGNRGGLGSWSRSNPNPGYTDNAIAAKTGDIYFYSPEQLVAGKGAPGKENLYLYRNGGVRQVTTLEDDPYCIHALAVSVNGATCSNGAVGRLQVTPDGRYAAFVTTSNVTAYNSHGFAEMYRYNAETEKVVCVSCRPNGSPPVDDVFGSQGGRFLTDDGRVFFETTEPLDPRDSNAGVDAKGQLAGSDVYEFVDGRPQLITTGTGTGVTSGTGFASASVPGLYGASADGSDVYFGTSDTLVGQDRNGAQLKFYDARTNGGFPFVPSPAPCTAADECHGPSSTAPAPIASGTGNALGAGGNARKAHKTHKRKHHKRKSKQRKRSSRGRAAQQRTGGSR